MSSAEKIRPERSWASWIASQPTKKREQLLAEAAEKLGLAGIADLRWCWPFWARPSQQMLPSPAPIDLLLAGRGYGKTRVGSEQLRQKRNIYRRTTMIGPTLDAVVGVMVEGESGVLNICPPNERPNHRPGKKRLDWPNGHRTHYYTAEEPERLRGPQHQWIWMEEVGSWRYPEAFDQAMFGLRLPPAPGALITTTPKPIRIIRDLVARDDVRVVRGTSYDNVANLDPLWFKTLIKRYEGSRMGRQELLAELLDDVMGALWRRDFMPKHTAPPERDYLDQLVLSLDPAVSDSESSAQMGMILGGSMMEGKEKRGYVLSDLTMRGTPEDVAKRVEWVHDTLHLDKIVVEVNNGGDWIPAVLNTRLHGSVLISKVRASKGKKARAEPISAEYEQGRWRHAPMKLTAPGHAVQGITPLADLEDQLCTWVPDSGEESPDRLDALVWLGHELAISGLGVRQVNSPLR